MADDATGTTAGDTALHRSPLHPRHLELGAKLAPFGGWQMPLEYGGGVLKEHLAVRQRVGVFDVSHLGKIRLTGPGAAAYVDRCLTNALERIAPGKAQYSLACDDATGGIVDDLICYLHGDDDVFLVPNAGNSAEVARRLASSAPDDVVVVDQHHDHAVLAVQGPRSGEVLARLGLPAELDYMSFEVAPLGGVALTVCRTGYTGERGYELVLPSSAAGSVWDALLEAGEPEGIAPCGLAARDTLRTEMGYPLHGQDISLDVTPLQGRLGWAVGWGKPAFWGRETLLVEKQEGPRRVLRGLLAQGRGIPRHGMQVLLGDEPVGEVTSGTFSPSLRTGIALGLVATTVGEGEEVAVDVRGRKEPFTVTRPPFVDTHVRDS